MVVGDGNVAKTLQDRPDRLYFASGVSWSLETRETEYQREKDLLLAQRRDLKLVYFSSLCIFYSKSRYAQHKREMEQLVKSFPSYTIIRLGNLEWDKNPHTLINALRDKKRKGEKLEIQNVYRYVISKKEFLHWISMIPEFNCEMNLPGKMMLVKDIVKEYV